VFREAALGMRLRGEGEEKRGSVRRSAVFGSGNGGSEKESESEREGRKEEGRESRRKRKCCRKALIQIVRAAGSAKQVLLLELEIQWRARAHSDICMSDRYANQGNLLKKYEEISSN